MRASLWSALFCAASVAAVPGSRHEERSTVSPDATCGGTDGYTCLGSFYGDCCSSSGYCGTTNVYCGQGCQSAFGNCTSTVGGLVVSTDGTCGSGITCEGSTYGNCCSQYGYWYVGFLISFDVFTNRRPVVRQVTIAAQGAIAPSALARHQHHQHLRQRVLLLQQPPTLSALLPMEILLLLSAAISMRLNVALIVQAIT